MRAALLAGTIGIAMGWSCVRNKQLPMGPSRLHWGGTVFGHRGCRHVPGIPENTLDAFKYAISRGCGGIECDVRLTKDNEVVVFHDACISGQLREASASQQELPTSAAPLRRVDECTLFELKACTYVEDPTEQIRVPTLEESILFCRENNLKMLIEIKEWRRYPLCVAKVLELFRRYPDYLYEHATVISFHPSILYNLRQRDSRIAVGQIYCKDLVQSMQRSGQEPLPGWARLCPSVVDRALVLVQEKISPWLLGCSMICPHYGLYSETYRRRWHSRRLAIYLWGFEESSQCSPEMRQPGVLVSADDRHDHFATPKPPPNFDVFGDRAREKERMEEEERKRLKLR